LGGKARNSESGARTYREHPQLGHGARFRAVEHHAALPYVEMAAFMTALLQRDGIGAQALEFAILPVARTGEVIGARWDEINVADRLRVVPWDRKSPQGTSCAAQQRRLAIVEKMAKTRAGD
jgi:hypothetical protein